MMEWKTVRLGDIISISSGQIYKGEFLGTGKNLLLGMGCVSFKEKFLYSGARQYSGDCADNKIARPGDIVLATRQQSDNMPILAMPAYIPSDLVAEKVIVGSNLYKVNLIDGSFDSRFIYWLMKTPDYVNYISSVKTGTTVKMITKSDVENYTFKCPPIEIRQKISDALWTLDDKIENNRKINKNLEEQAQALFKSWFVDFEPFKDGEFVDSELGMIPKGWRVYGFNEFLTASTEKVGREGVTEYSVTNTGIHPRDEKFMKSLSKTSAKNKILRKGNLVFGMSRDILNWGIMKDSEGGVSSAYNIYLVDEDKVDVVFLENFITHRMDYFHDLIKPATREGQGLDKTALMSKFVYMPTAAVISDFMDKYLVLKSQIEIINQESRRLAQLRDTLLPKLMNGEIEI